MSEHKRIKLSNATESSLDHADKKPKDEKGSEETWEGQECFVVPMNWTQNYIIVEKVMNGLSWQDHERCSQVCRLWNEVVKNLQKKNLNCYDYAIVKNGSDEQVFIETSNSLVQAKPLICFSFGLNFSSTACTNYSPSPCEKPCKKHHSYSDVIQARLLCKGAHHISVAGFPKIYEPLSTADTYQYTVHPTMKAVLGGLHLPHIPGVNVNVLLYRRKALVKRDVFSRIDEICSTDIVRGVNVFVEERMMLIETEKLEFIKYLKTVQPDEPFALGGCVVGTVSSHTVGADNGSQCSVMAVMVVFSVPRSNPGDFHMFSLLFHSSLNKAPMKEDVRQFAEQVGKSQYSACLKLSCIGRDSLHSKELTIFREAFPTTPVVGCFGNGEIGYHYPRKYTTNVNGEKFCMSKHDNYSFTYCTVFVLFLWGKVLQPPRLVEDDEID